MKPSSYVGSRFVVIIRRGTFTSLLQAAMYAEQIKLHDPENVLTVDIVPTHTDRAMLESARAE